MKIDLDDILAAVLKVTIIISVLFITSLSAAGTIFIWTALLRGIT